MKDVLQHIIVKDYTTEKGVLNTEIKLSYQVFGHALGSAPIVLVNHALTGNSDVAGTDGWWKDLVGNGKVIDTKLYTILAFNIPGNGFDGFIIDNYKDFVARDVAKLFLIGLDTLKIDTLFATIGGSLGGGIAWEMAVLQPNFTTHLVVVATDWKSTDWLIANCQIQEQFLLNSKHPVHDARMHAMTCYRTPESFKKRFHRSQNRELEIFNVESWLLHHGNKLQERFQLSAYKLMNQLLRSIDVTKGRASNFNVLENIEAKIHIVGVDSDLFFTAEENRETHKQLALTHPNVTYSEIHSVHGHDAFLMEYEQLEKIIEGIFVPYSKRKPIKILKFGGKSLANGKGLETVLGIIKSKVASGERIGVVVSARGSATDDLEIILNKAVIGESYKDDLEAFKNYQTEPLKSIDFSKEFEILDKLFAGVSLLRDCSDKTKDSVLAQGELLAIKIIAGLLNDAGVSAKATDARKLIKTDDNFGNAKPIAQLSKELTQSYFFDNKDVVNIVTGFIASNLNNETTTLGRNGSNYTAALIANFLDAEELQNYTHVSGIYTADPVLVPDAKQIRELSFSEANELANFGTSILHAKTIIPLVEKNINLRILNTFNGQDEGTLITARPSKKEVTSLSILKDVALLNFEGRGLLGEIGIDARIFGALGRNGISVSIVSQGSSERGIGLIINANQAAQAVTALQQEFKNDFYSQDVNKIDVNNDVAVISIIGIELSAFHKPFNALIKNQITPLLFNNTVTGKNVSLVVNKSELHKAVNVVHGEIFGVSKKINLAIFGHGGVGRALINQILKSKSDIEKRKGISLNIFAIANSKKLWLDKNGADTQWETAVKKNDNIQEDTVNTIIRYAKNHHLENLVAVDNTASSLFHTNYIPMVKAGFDLVSSNKIANTISHKFYKELRVALQENNKTYLYETTVGAGLPLIDTIKLLHESGENITRIRGVFSGTLSYLFNNFSKTDKPFSAIIKETVDKGFTEPDPREDFSGNDVARKLLILARELDLKNEFEDVEVLNLIPKAYRNISVDSFLSQLEVLDAHYEAIKVKQKAGHVLRYVGDLSGDLSKDKGRLEVKLVSVLEDSTLGHVKGSDAIFEIFTQSYGEQPIVIQGAGAGAEVTARGVFGDILRLSKHN